MGFLLRTHGLGLAAMALGVSIFFSRILGLVRDKVISYYFGATLEADIYFTAFVVPDFLNYLLAGGYFSITLVPLLSSLFVDNEKEGWRFFSAAALWAFISIAALTVLAWWQAPALARYAAPGFTPPALERLVTFLRIILPAQVFFLPGACFTAVLYCRKQFTVPALSPLIYNAAIIVSGIAVIGWWPEKGMEGFCWGVSGGALIGSFLLPFLAVKAGGMRLSFCLLHPSMKHLLILALPLMLGQSVTALDEQLLRIFGSMAPEGSISLLSYARRIMHVPVGVIAQAAGLASFPFLASLAAKGETGAFNARLQGTVKNSILIALPVSCWMMLAAEPTMRLIFQQGSFSSQEAAQSGVLLMVMLASVLFWTLQQILGRAFYAYKDTITPTIAGTVATAFSLPAYWYGVRFLGAAGVALAGSLSIMLYTFLLMYAWIHRFGVTAFAGIALCIAQVLIVVLPACGLAAVAAHYAKPFIFPETLGGAALEIAITGKVFCAVYFFLAWRFFPDLCAPFVQLIRRKLHGGG